MTDTQWEPPEAVKEPVARALYQRECETTTHADAVLSMAAGKLVSLGIEPFEEHKDCWLRDARAVILASPLPECVAVLRQAVDTIDYLCTVIELEGAGNVWKEEPAVIEVIKNNRAAVRALLAKLERRTGGTP